MGLIRDGLATVGKGLIRISATPPTQKASNWEETFFGGGWNALPFNSYRSKKSQLEAYVDWTYTAVRAIAEEGASIDFRLYVNRSSRSNRSLSRRLAYAPHEVAPLFRQRVLRSYSYGDRAVVKELSALEELDSHILLDLLNNPNRFMTKDEFFELVYQHLELAGESFTLKLRDGRGVVEELWPLMPDAIEVAADAKQFIKGYVYSVGGKKIPLVPEDVIHLKHMDPANLLRGIGVVEAAARAIDTDVNAADWNRRFFKNSARPDAVLSTDGTLEDKTFYRLQQQWEDKYGGTENAHKPAILEGGLKYTPLNFNQRDMDFLKSRQFNRDQILAMFRVSPAILGMTENVNRANAEASEYIFAKRVIKPKLQKLVDKFTATLASEFDEKLVIGFTDPVPQDKEHELNYKVKATNKWLTRDEVRELEGRKPLESGVGSVIYGPISEQPLAGPRLSDEGKALLHGMKLLAAEQSKLQEDLSKLNSGKKKLATQTKTTLYQSEEEREAIGEARVVQVDKLAQVYEQGFLEAAGRRFDIQRRKVVANLRKSGYEPEKQAEFRHKDLLDDILFDVDDETRLMVAAFLPIYDDLIEQFGTQALLLVSATQAFDPSDPAIARFYEGRAQKIARDVNEETEKQLRASLTEGINGGESVDELMVRVERVFGIAAITRTERIARTESIRTNTFADIVAWDQSGVVESKEWYTAADHRVCPFCRSMAEQANRTIPLHETYFDKGERLTVPNDKGENVTLKLDYEAITGPPIHVSCRCVLLPVLKKV